MACLPCSVSGHGCTSRRVPPVHSGDAADGQTAKPIIRHSKVLHRLCTSLCTGARCKSRFCTSLTQSDMHWKLSHPTPLSLFRRLISLFEAERSPRIGRLRQRASHRRRPASRLVPRDRSPRRGAREGPQGPGQLLRALWALWALWAGLHGTLGLDGRLGLQLLGEEGDGLISDVEDGVVEGPERKPKDDVGPSSTF